MFGTVVVPSFLHGLLHGGHVLGLRFGRASAAAVIFAALLDMVAHQFCSCTAAAFVGVFTLVVAYVWLDCDFTVMADSVAACTAFEGVVTLVGVGKDAFKYVVGVRHAGAEGSRYAFEEAKATPRVDVAETPVFGTGVSWVCTSSFSSLIALLFPPWYWMSWRALGSLGTCLVSLWRGRWLQRSSLCLNVV